MKIKIRNNLNGMGKQIEILPSFDIFWDEKIYCIAIGWLIVCFEFWFGETDDLI